MSQKPVVFDLEQEELEQLPDVAAAPPVPDPLPELAEMAPPAAMEQAACRPLGVQTLTASGSTCRSISS